MTEKGDIIAGSVFLGLALISLVLRCYSRFVLKGAFGIDDVCVLLSYLSAVALTVVVVQGSRHGMHQGDFISELKKPDKQAILKYLFWDVICFTIGTTLVKNSAILQCLRFILFGKTRTFCWAFLALINVFGVLAVLLCIFQCKPIQASWRADTQVARCLDISAFWYVASVIMIAMTATTIAIPIITVRKLNVPRNQKIALMVVFALGGFTCVASIVRIYYMSLTRSDHNLARGNSGAAIWASIELNIDIVCVCLPPLKPILLKIVPSFFGSAETIDPDLGTSDTEVSGLTLTPTSPDQGPKVSRTSILSFPQFISETELPQKDMREQHHSIV